MKLIIGFSGRRNGNCDGIASYIANSGDRIVRFGELKARGCSNCGYECFDGECKYRADEVYGLYESMLQYDRVVLIVPMYCGNPSSLYFTFNERGQDYFMHNDTYDEIVKRLYIIGVYGSKEANADFVPCLEKWFEGSNYENRVLGIERHLYGQRLDDCILDIEKERVRIDEFLR